MQAINDFILAAAGQPWVLLLVLACCVIDGFFPPIPSESVVVGLAAVAATADVPNPWLLMLMAALGAFGGDNIAYLIGRRVGTRRWRWMRGPRMQTAFHWAGNELQEAAGVPGARGPFCSDWPGGGEPHGRCHALSAPAVRGADGVVRALWSSYSVAIGLFFGQWFEDNHLLGATIAIVCAILLGIIVDILISRFRGRLPEEPAEEPASGP